MSLINVLKGAKIIEAIENYSVVDNVAKFKKALVSSEKALYSEFYDDQQFWSEIIQHGKHYWNKPLSLRSFVISEWVARVPGLYWADHSQSLRRHSENDVAVKSKQWVELYPPGKSRKILGGIGTVLLPPNEDGKRIISLSSSCNASLGVPALIFPDVYESLNLSQGDVVDVVDAKWQALDTTWAKKFASTKDIPRGYLVIDKPHKIRIRKRDLPVAYHPFSIMEYQSEDALLYDFVYLSVDSKVKNVRREVEEFFDYYAKKEGRNGKYLLNPDMIDPLFETQYNSPLDMQSPSEKAKIELLHKRINEVNLNKTTLNKLIQVLPKHYDSSVSIRRLAKNTGISAAILQEDNAASMSAQLINYCMDVGKITELVDRMSVEYSDIFKQ